MPGIAFYKPTTLLGRIVAWATRSPWCHVAIIHKVQGIQVVTSAQPPSGVTPIPAEKYQAPDAYFDMPWLDDEEVTAWLVHRWATSYSLWEALGVVRFKYQHNTTRNRSGTTCAELATFFLAFSIAGQNFPGGFQAKIQPIFNMPANAVSPDDLAKVLL
jgi:hypothetical protein